MSLNTLEPPPFLTGYDREAWFRFLPVLRQQNIYEDRFHAAFEGLCSLYGQVRTMQDERRAAIVEGNSQKVELLAEMELEAVRLLRDLAHEFYFRVLWQRGVSVDLVFVGPEPLE